jgi:hypothetical protein
MFKPARIHPQILEIPDCALSRLAIHLDPIGWRLM